LNSSAYDSPLIVNPFRKAREQGTMLLRIVALATVLLAISTVSAQDTHARKPPIPYPTNPAPAQQPPQPANQPLASPAGSRASQDGMRSELQLLLQQKCAELDQLQREIKQLREATGTAQQILVKVQMLEVSLTKLRQLGMDMNWSANAHFSEAKMRQDFESTDGRAHSSTTEWGAKEGSNVSLLFVDALKRQNLAKVLAEPNIIVVSGRPGSFNVGGEFPLPAQKDAKSAVDFQKYGTELNIQALSLGDNQVRLEVRTRVSEIDEGRAIEINGTRVPGLNVRECDTACELSFGQSAVLTGLVQQRMESYRVDGGDTKEALVDVGLMVVVTPELVDRPGAPSASANHDMNRAQSK
jgi:Flp pilus assembly secretin CpaC